MDLATSTPAVDDGFHFVTPSSPEWAVAMTPFAVFAMPAPPSFQFCCVLAMMLGGFSSVCVFMVVRRFPQSVNRTSSAACVTAIATLVGIVSVLAYPIRQAPDSMPHFVGFSAQDALIHATFGSIAGCVISSAVAPFFTRRRIPKTRLVRILLTVSASLTVLLLARLFITSAFVGAIVLLMIVSLLFGVTVSVWLYLSTDSAVDTQGEHVQTTT